MEVMMCSHFGTNCLDNSVADPTNSGKGETVRGLASDG